jgi:hypothetical protein
VETGNEEAAFKPRDRVNGLLKPRDGSLSPDGRWVATAGGDTGAHETVVWNTADGPSRTTWRRGPG